MIELQINSDPRRGSTEDAPLNKVRIDSIAELELKSQGYTSTSIPNKDIEVLIQRNGNVAFDVTDLVHPSIAKKVVLAAKVVGLDIAGVDLVAKDISKPLEEQGAAIVEVNAGPGLLMHINPAKGKPQPVGEAIIHHLFPLENSSRIPLIGVCGSKGATVVAEICAYFLKLSNFYVALSNQRGLSFNQRWVDKNGSTEWELGRRTLLNPLVEAAVIEATAKGILMQGVPYDFCSVGIITEIDKTIFYPEQAITEEHQLFSIYRTQVDTVIPHGVAVINADEPMASEMAKISESEVIFYGIDASTPLLSDFSLQGGRSIITQQQQMILRHGNEQVYVFNLDDSEYLKQDEQSSRVSYMMAAVGAAWALGLSFQTIETGIETFFSEELIA